MIQKKASLHEPLYPGPCPLPLPLPRASGVALLETVKTSSLQGQSKAVSLRKEEIPEFFEVPTHCLYNKLKRLIEPLAPRRRTDKPGPKGVMLELEQ